MTLGVSGYNEAGKILHSWSLISGEYNNLYIHVWAVQQKVVVSNQFTAHFGMSLSFRRYEYGIFMHLYPYKYPASVFEYWILL